MTDGVEEPQINKQAPRRQRYAAAIKSISIGFLVLLVLGVIAWGGLFVLKQQLLKPATNTADLFLSDIKANNVDAAYNLLSDGYQKQLSKNELKIVLGSEVFKIALGGDQNVASKKLGSDKDTAEVSINFRKDNELYRVKFKLMKIQNDWKIDNIELL